MKFHKGLLLLGIMLIALGTILYYRELSSAPTELNQTNVTPWEESPGWVYHGTT